MSPSTSPTNTFPRQVESGSFKNMNAQQKEISRQPDQEKYNAMRTAGQRGLVAVSTES